MRSLTTLALACAFVLLGSSRSLASTGGDSGVGDFCLEAGGKKVLFVHSEGGESGCWDSLGALDLATGTHYEIVPCGEEHEEERQKARTGCEPLVARSLDSLGLRATISGSNERPKAVTAESLPEFPDLLRPAGNVKVLTLRRGKRALGSIPVTACAFGMTDSRPRTASLVAFGLPGKRFAVVTVTTLSVCYESTYKSTEELFLEDGWRESAKTPAGPTVTEVPLGLLPTDFAKTWNDAGMTLYRAGRLKDAAAYFEYAYDVPAVDGKGPHNLLALFNGAATLAKLGEDEKAFAAIELLLSHEKERARFRKKILADPDFAKLHGSERLRILLTDPSVP